MSENIAADYRRFIRSEMVVLAFLLGVIIVTCAAFKTAAGSDLDGGRIFVFAGAMLCLSAVVDSLLSVGLFRARTMESVGSIDGKGLRKRGLGLIALSNLVLITSYAVLVLLMFESAGHAIIRTTLDIQIVICVLVTINGVYVLWRHGRTKRGGALEKSI